MSVVLTGQERIGMRDASKLLGCHYETVLKYVVELKLVPFIRRGAVKRKVGKNGKPVFIDEHGLEKLREFLPKVTGGERSESGLSRSAPTGSAQGL